MDSLIIFGAKYLFLAVPLIFLAALYRADRRTRRRLIVAIVCALVIAAVLDKLAGQLYYDPRPFVSQHIKPLVAHAADNGFPSEHTLFSFCFAAVIFFYQRRLGWLTLGVGLLVGFSRVAAHVHSPIDIAAGIIIGVAAGYGGKWLAEKLLAKLDVATPTDGMVPDKDHQGDYQQKVDKRAQMKDRKTK